MDYSHLSGSQMRHTSYKIQLTIAVFPPPLILCMAVKYTLPDPHFDYLICNLYSSPVLIFVYRCIAVVLKILLFYKITEMRNF